jgi:hypothetical protein
MKRANAKLTKNQTSRTGQLINKKNDSMPIGNENGNQREGKSINK